MKVFIYTLEHPITNEVRYVGKTKNPKMRFHNHCNKLHNEKTHKRNWINNLRKENLRPVMEILDEVEESEWKYWEKFWIEQFRQWGFNLVNHTSGGDGLTIGNITSFKKGHRPWNYGTRKPKILKGNRGRTENSIKNQFKKGVKPWNTGIKGVKLKHDKNVYQFNKERTIMIRKWNTAKEAGNTLNINIEGIGQCARGNSKSCGGYYWNYKNILL